MVKRYVWGIYSENIAKYYTNWNQLLRKKIDGFEKRLDQKLEKMEQNMEGEMWKVSDRVHRLEIERENELDRPALLELREKEFGLRLRRRPEEKGEGTEDMIIQMLVNLTGWEMRGWRKK